MRNGFVPRQRYGSLHRVRRGDDLVHRIFQCSGFGNSTSHPPPGFAVGVVMRDRGGSDEAKAAIERNGRAD